MNKVIKNPLVSQEENAAILEKILARKSFSNNYIGLKNLPEAQKILSKLQKNLQKSGEISATRKKLRGRDRKYISEARKKFPKLGKNFQSRE